MTYPDSGDYLAAVQSPALSFTDPRYQTARFPVGQFGMPLFGSGNSAVVVRAEVGGDDRALRFYTKKEDPQARKRYTGLQVALHAPALRPHAATATWIEDAVTLRGRRWPMVDMQWVEGKTLGEQVEALTLGRHGDALRHLAEQLRALIRTLQGAGFAHGDLQHGNVMIDVRNELRPRLVDFDSSWIETFAAMDPPAEIGHPNYQHPSREWGRWMDTFPGLVIYTALLGLANDPARWSSSSTEDRIVFRSDDFTQLTSPTWDQLDTIDDPQVRHAVAALRHCCDKDWTASGSLDALLDARPRTGEKPADETKPTPDAEMPWWQRAAAAAAPSATSPAQPDGPPSAGTPNNGRTATEPPSATRPHYWDRQPPPDPPGPRTEDRPPPRPAAPPPSAPAPRRKKRWIPLIAAAVVLCWVLLGFALLTTRSTSLTHPTTTRTSLSVSTPPTASSPQALGGNEAALRSSLLMRGVDPSSCQREAATEQAVAGVRAVISCAVVDSPANLRIWYLQFADPASMGGYMTAQAGGIHNANGRCDAGQDADTTWSQVGGPDLGRMVCANLTSNGTPYYAIVWASNATDTVAAVAGLQPAATYSWWSQHAVQFRG